MIYLILLIVVVVVIYMVVRPKGSAKTAPENFDSDNKGEPRDFLKEAEGALSTPKPLREMLEQNKSYVIEKLIEILDTEGIYQRKYAAFALGQIGEVSAIEALENQLSVESVEGVREAIEAALVTLRRVPANKGSSELDRRMLIEDVYNKRPPRI
jgi:hypothetical protein